MCIEFQVDLFFAYSIQIYEAFNDFSFITLENSQPQVIVPKNHRLAKQDKVSLYDLKDENFIMWAQEMYPGYHNYFRQVCEEYGFTPKIVKEISDKEDQLFSILSGKGIGIRSGLDDGYIDPDTFSLVTIEMDENKFNDAFLLALGWNKNNKNPCSLPALSIVKETMCVASME